ncbi:MFS general substrate transporter [Hypoxylon sp. NC0597]|nr:MFS general substrate transporter [Hypoxylon sp. NC0597]
MTAVGTTAESTSSWITGWRLIFIALGTSLSLFMVQTEASITSTAITAITNTLGGFDRSSWVFTAYLVTYSSFPIFFSKLSDILGRKQVMLACLVLFAAFSGACGAAQTLTQLIMFRWIKGIGAGGIIAIGTLYGFELRPPDKWPGYSAFITTAIAMSLAIAPVIGAAFTQAGLWRWCFLMNVPIGVTTAVILLLTMPNKLSLEPAARLGESGFYPQIITNLRRLDFLGVSMLAGVSVLLMTALQQAASVHGHDRRNAWLSGLVLTVTLVQIPQRFMLVNSLSAIDAGVRLLPFTAVIALTSVLAAIIASKAKIPAVYVLIFGACIEVAGVAGLSRTSTQPTIELSQYGFQVLAGAGVGIYNIILILLTPYVVERKDLAVANGAINQARLFGGSLGLSVVACATNRSLRAHLMQIVSPIQVDLILDRTETIVNLPPETQALVRRAFGDMYNMQMTITIGIAAAQFLLVFLQWQRKAIILKG